MLRKGPGYCRSLRALGLPSKSKRSELMPQAFSIWLNKHSYIGCLNKRKNLPFSKGSTKHKGFFFFRPFFLALEHHGGISDTIRHKISGNFYNRDGESIYKPYYSRIYGTVDIFRWIISSSRHAASESCVSFIDHFKGMMKFRAALSHRSGFGHRTFINVALWYVQAALPPNETLLQSLANHVETWAF